MPSSASPRTRPALDGNQPGPKAALTLFDHGSHTGRRRCYFTVRTVRKFFPEENMFTVMLRGDSQAHSFLGGEESHGTSHNLSKVFLRARKKREATQQPDPKPRNTDYCNSWMKHRTSDIAPHLTDSSCASDVIYLCTTYLIRVWPQAAFP